jgi:hypothetical protein
VLAQSASGDHALLYSNGEEHQDAFTGTSTIGFVKLDDCPSDGDDVVPQRAVRSQAQPIHDVVIDESAAAVVAALRFDTHVQVVGFGAAECELGIEPAGAAARDAFRPADVALLEGWVAVRSEASSEVLVVDWSPDSPCPEPRVEHLVDAGGTPTDMLLLKVGGQPHLATLAPSSSSPGTSLLVDFDLEAGERTELALDFEATQLDLIEGEPSRVLVASTVAGDAALAVIALEPRPALEAGSPLRLPQGFARVPGSGHVR